MQAMSRRGISEQRQRSMVAMLMFSLADATAPLRMASASPGGHTLSPIWCQTSGLPSGCIRSCMTGASMSAMSCPWLSSRWHRALYDTQFCQGSWCIHACFVHRYTRCTEPAKYKHQQDMHRVCMERRCWFTSRCVMRDELWLRFNVRIPGLPRWVGVARPRCIRQAALHGAMSSFYHACLGCRSFHSVCSLRQSDLVSMISFCAPFLPWFISPVACKVMGVYPAGVDGRAFFSARLTRPVSFYAEGTFSGRSDDYGYARLPSLSGTPLWDPVGNRAPGAGSSYALAGYYLSRLAQVSLGVATFLGQPTRGANSSNCLQYLLLAGIGSCDIMIHRSQDASTELVLLIHVRSPPALRFRLRLSGLGGQYKHDLLHVYLSGSQDRSCQHSIRATRGSSPVDSAESDANLFFRLFFSDALSVWFSCATITPSCSSLCLSPVKLETCMRQRSTGDWHYGRRCYRAYLMLPVAPGPSCRDLRYHGIHVRSLLSSNHLLAGRAALHFGSSMSQWRCSVQGGILYHRGLLCATWAQGGAMLRISSVKISVQRRTLSQTISSTLGDLLSCPSIGEVAPWVVEAIVDVGHTKVRLP